MSDRGLVTCLLTLLLTLWSGNATTQEPTARQPARRIDGYKGIWFTLGQFYGKGTGDKAYSPNINTARFSLRRQVFRRSWHLHGKAHAAGDLLCGGRQDLLCLRWNHRAERAASVMHGFLLTITQTHGPRPSSFTINRASTIPTTTQAWRSIRRALWVFVSGRARVRPGFKYRSVKPLQHRSNSSWSPRKN